MLSERKRLEEDYGMALKQVGEKVEAIISKHEKEFAAKLKEIDRRDGESHCDERLKKM